MDILHLDCTKGMRKDTLVASLLAQLPQEEQRAFLERFNAVGFPDLVASSEERAEAEGGEGTDVSTGATGDGAAGGSAAAPLFVLRYKGRTERELRGDHHDHHSVEEVARTIGGLSVSARVAQDALGIYRLLAEAEAKAHDTTVGAVHFHEVGNEFAIGSIIAACMLMEELDPCEVTTTPVTVGYGYIECAHGTLPVPAPATAFVLEGFPTVIGDVEGERCTPTGAAMVRYFADRVEPLQDQS